MWFFTNVNPVSFSDLLIWIVADAAVNKSNERRMLIHIVADAQATVEDVGRINYGTISIDLQDVVSPRLWFVTQYSFVFLFSKIAHASWAIIY